MNLKSRYCPIFVFIPGVPARPIYNRMMSLTTKNIYKKFVLACTINLAKDVTMLYFFFLYILLIYKIYNLAIK